jgi:hypothetical protein
MVHQPFVTSAAQLLSSQPSFSSPACGGPWAWVKIRYL